MQTIWIELHAFRGFFSEATLFGPVLRVGFISLGISKFVLTDWVARWRSALGNVGDP